MQKPQVKFGLYGLVGPAGMPALPTEAVAGLKLQRLGAGHPSGFDIV
jgi:hypothetical protein